VDECKPLHSGCKRLTDLSARAIAKLKKLEFLDITRCYFTNQGLVDIALSPRGGFNLRHLNLYAVSTYTDRSFACLAVLSNLRFLDLCGRGLYSSTSQFSLSRLLSLKPPNTPNMSHKNCSRQAEQ